MTIAKVDSKGRITLPRQVQEMLGEVVEMKNVGKEKVLLSKAKRTQVESISRGRRTESLAKLLDKEPRRTGKPENPSPDEMKSIWAE